jgi:hypothetical protein
MVRKRTKLKRNNQPHPPQQTTPNPTLGGNACPRRRSLCCKGASLRPRRTLMRGSNLNRKTKKTIIMKNRNNRKRKRRRSGDCNL